MSKSESRPIFFHILINAPRLCKSMNMNVKNDERIFDLIYRIVNNAGLIETNTYKLYGLSDNFVEIPSENLCSSLFLTSYDSLYLFGKAEEYLVISSVYYDTKKTIITTDMHSESSRLVSMAVKCLKISIDGAFYVLYNPNKYEIYPLDEALVNDDEIEDNLSQEESGKILQLRFVLKQFCIFISQFVFCPTPVNSDPSEDKNIENPPWMDLISKDSLSISNINEYFIPPTFKKLLSKVNKQIKANIQNSKEPLTLSKLDFQKVDSIISNYDNENCIDSLTNEETNSLLFYLLSMHKKSYISESLHQKIIQVMKSSIIQKNSDEEEEEDSESNIELFYNISALLALMPLCTQCILLELCKCFELIPSNKSVIQLVTRSMIPNSASIDQKVEENFFAFILLYYEFLFDVPNPNHVLMQEKSGKLIIKPKSESNHDENLIEFPRNRNIFDTIEQLVDKELKIREMLDEEKFEKLNITLENVSKLEEKKRELMRQIKEKLDE